MLLILNALASAEAGPQDPRPRLRPDRPAGLRTSRLTGEGLEKWKAIVDIVMAKGSDGQPLHPTLRRLWEAVDTSGHTTFIEMRDTRSCIAGRFEVTTVDPEGEAHEGTLILNLRVIDKASTGPAAARANGFVPFKGLGKAERYAEVLGHELAHAEWALASPEKARLAQRLQGRLAERARVRLAAGPGSGLRETLQEQDAELERLARELEEPAETAEVAIWEELQASRRHR
jgi:hypothetical protein